MKPLVVVVSGAPGSGKTSLARALGDAIHLPVLSRDLVKSGMHVTTDRQQASETRRFSEASYDLFHHTIEEWTRHDVSLIAEAAFHAEHATPRLRRLAERCVVVNVRTHVPVALALERYRGRAVAGLRHSSHGDDEYLRRAASSDFDWNIYELDLGTTTLDVETVEPVDVTLLTKAIQGAHGSEP